MRTFTAKQTAGISAGSVVAVIGCVIGVASFLEVTPAAIRQRESRILALEQAQQTALTHDQGAELSRKIDDLSRKLSEVERLLRLYQITEDGLAPRRRP